MVDFELKVSRDESVVTESTDDIMNLVIESADTIPGTNPMPGGLSEEYRGDWDEIKIPITGGDSEKPDSKPYDETKILSSASKEDNPQIYAQALNDLKRSFKESIEVIDLLEKSLATK